jgi:hypothetical protein
MPLTDRFLVDTRLEAEDSRFLVLFGEALSRIPSKVSPINTVDVVRLRRKGPMTGLAGLTHWKHEGREGVDDRGLVAAHEGRQTITFYSGLLDQLSDPSYIGVIAHELAHAWLNEHALPEESGERELEANELAKRWGFEDELAALDAETESV